MSDFQHYGVPGMKWGQRKVQNLVGGGSSPALPHLKSAVYGLRKDVGFLVSREILRNYSHLTIPAAKSAGKATIKFAKYTPRVAKGAGAALRILGSGAKVAGRGGKAYVKGAISIARMVR